MDLRDRRELNNGAGDALNRAVELVVTPMIFGFLGFVLDAWLGTRPLCMFVLFLSVLGYVVWKNFAVYSREMDKEQRRVLGASGERAPASRTAMGLGGAAPTNERRVLGGGGPETSG